MTKINLMEYIENHIITCDISYRGGTLKIDVSELFSEIDPSDAIIGASQNYLGGGMAGSISGGAMFSPSDLSTKKDKLLFSQLLDAAKKYFYNVNNGGGDEYMQDNVTGKDTRNGFKKLQSLPKSGY